MYILNNMINTPWSDEINNKEQERTTLWSDYKIIQDMYLQLVEDTRSEDLIQKNRFPSHFANFMSWLLNDSEDPLLAYSLLQLLTKYIDILWQTRKDNKDKYMLLITESIDLSSAYKDLSNNPTENPRYWFKELLEHVFKVAGYDLENEENKKILESMVNIRNK